MITRLVDGYSVERIVLIFIDAYNVENVILRLVNAYGVKLTILRLEGSVFPNYLEVGTAVVVSVWSW